MRALGTYSQLAPSALTEMTQPEEETELDDAIYDDQLSHNLTQGQERAVEAVRAEPASALNALNAGPVQATIDAEIPAAAAAASQVIEAAGHLTTEQHEDSILASSLLPDALATLATAATDAAGSGTDHAAASSGLQTEVSPLLVGVAAEQDPASLIRQPEGQGRKAQAVFCPARLVEKKYALPPKVDHRWGPLKLCEKWMFRLRGYRKAHKPEDDGAVEEEEGKQQAQLNQQEGRATGTFCQNQKSNRKWYEQTVIGLAKHKTTCIIVDASACTFH